MQSTYTWRVIPSTEPNVIRNCPKCGCHSEYESTKNFRVNANQSHIDVWLIYQCTKCKSTWNMEILSRVNPKTIAKELYSKFLSNDQELAMQYAFDLSIHHRNKSVLDSSNIEYQIIGDAFSPTEMNLPMELMLISDYPLDLRIDKILSSHLGLSREQIKKLNYEGKITSDGDKDIIKAKLKNNMTLKFSGI